MLLQCHEFTSMCNLAYDKRTLDAASQGGLGKGKLMDVADCLVIPHSTVHAGPGLDIDAEGKPIFRAMIFCTASPKTLEQGYQGNQDNTMSWLLKCAQNVEEASKELYEMFYRLALIYYADYCSPGCTKHKLDTFLVHFS